MLLQKCPKGIQLSVEIRAVEAYWNSRPCNIRHSQKKVGTVEYFNEVEQRKYFVEPHIPIFADFDRWKGKRVLEIGCGIGTDAINFARAGADYVGIDLSSESLDIARSRFAVFGLSGTLYCGNAEELGEVLCEEAPFDLIYSFGVLHHTPNPEKALDSAREKISATGELRIMLYAQPSWKSALIGAGLQQPEAQSGCPIAEAYTAGEVDALLVASGWVCTSLSRAHIFPYKIEDYVNYKYIKEPWFEVMPPEIIEALERELGWHWLIQATPDLVSVETK